MLIILLILFLSAVIFKLIIYSTAYFILEKLIFFFSIILVAKMGILNLLTNWFFKYKVLYSAINYHISVVVIFNFLLLDTSESLILKKSKYNSPFFIPFMQELGCIPKLSLI